MYTEVSALLDSLERHRPYRAVFYSFLTAGGAILASDPWQSLKALDDVVRYGWGGFLIFGGALTLYGTFRDRWKTEMQGDILLGFAILGLIWVLIAGSGSSSSIVVACLFSALLTAIVSRLVGLWKLANAEGRLAKKQQRRQESR
jgi:hypothetical protein